MWKKGTPTELWLVRKAYVQSLLAHLADDPVTTHSGGDDRTPLGFLAHVQSPFGCPIIT
jgi:hypothetical protein